ncbi:MAG: 3-methyl-2-oxobutanoate hydroxymethyltransferase [Desulfurococcales archaeon]|nr:3-methyl-2-oxobutanoate hydroxymethyltransferase [Desulfurococcales archaeon]
MVPGCRIILSEHKKVTARKISKMKGKDKIVMVTAYDYPSAKAADEAGVDSILVGDSLAMVVHGMKNTHNVPIELMEYHVKAVARAEPSAHVVGDMPFMSYETGTRDAVINAGRLVAAGADSVKLEGGGEYSDVVRAIVRSGIPVMGHIGLTPQKYLALGGYRKMGRKPGEANEILMDAKALVDAGVFSIVIEYTSAEVARKVTQTVPVPTICIGSGPYCDGQVLVFHDLLGFSPYEPPPFAKNYANLYDIVRKGIIQYAKDVRELKFPGPEHYFD